MFVLAVKGVRLPESGIQVRFSGETEDSPGDCSKGGDMDAPTSAAGLPAECLEIRGSRELGEAVALYLSAPYSHPRHPGTAIRGGSKTCVNESSRDSFMTS